MAIFTVIAAPDWAVITNKPTNFQADWLSTVVNRPTNFQADWASTVINRPTNFQADWASTVINKPTIPTGHLVGWRSGAAGQTFTANGTPVIVATSTWNGGDAAGNNGTYPNEVYIAVAGKYTVIGYVNLYGAGGNTAADMHLYAGYNGGAQHDHTAQNPNWGGDGAHFTVSGTFNCNAGDRLSVMASANGGNVTPTIGEAYFIVLGPW